MILLGIPVTPLFYPFYRTGMMKTDNPIDHFVYKSYNLIAMKEHIKYYTIYYKLVN